MALTLFQRIVKRFNQTFSRFGEKSTVTIEDFELEHFLLYHGLIGSSPEGQRSFRDVRADLLAAVKSKSSLQMGITLKLMPLFWEDKLKAIVAEIKDTQRDEIISCLMPDNRDGMLAPNQNPPFADDWRVRANAATLIAYVGGPNAVEVLTKSLNDTAVSAKSAFCHTVLALASIKHPAALSAIEPFLFSEEQWFHVDSINAISYWPFDTVAEILAGGLTSINNFSDYAAFATARNHNPITFLKDSRLNVQNGGMAMILALCSPDHKALQLDQILPFDLASCFDDVVKLTKENGSALRLRAALNLIDWIAGNRLDISANDKDVADQKTLDVAKKSLLTEETKKELSTKFSQHVWQTDRSKSIKDLEGVCIIEMIGNFKDESQIAKLEELAAQENSYYTDAAVDALGKIGSSSASEKLIQIANRLVDSQERATKAASAQPVAEENQQASLTYWHILNALGNLKSEQSFDFLLSAVQDYAPDKRQKALSSLVSVGKSLSLSADKQTAMLEHLLKAFKDPSTGVRQTAIESAALLNDPALIEEVAAMTNARETSLWKEANRSLKSLSQQGHKDKVLAELNKRLQCTHDETRRERILNLTNELK